MPNYQSILILGVGELGMSVLRAVHDLIQQYSTPPQLTVLLRPQGNPTNQKLLERDAKLRDMGINIIRYDLAELSVQELADVLRPFDAIISCTGFAAGPGAQLKIAHAVLQSAPVLPAHSAAQKIPKTFIPWQFGVDYDAIGQGSGQDLFDEQLKVRALLRQQAMAAGVKWIIVSTGVFLGFAFLPDFGVVEGIQMVDGDEDMVPKAIIGEQVVVRALGAWENKLTVTHVEDIGIITARILFDDRVSNQVVFVAGDTISYSELAILVSDVLGRRVKTELWSKDMLQHALQKDHSDVMKKYRLAFASGIGVAWDKDCTYNAEEGISTVNVKQWLEKRVHGA